ncbi:MAG: PIN domain protein, partial [Candidatus Margulisbacteria bacterium]|nr:PIN domain protein [Candidatus Margulisiibacteriota bacterium]
IIARWKDLAKVDIDVSVDIVELGKKIMEKGIKKKDSLHLACALKAKSDYFLTIDKKLLNMRIDNIVIINPLDFVRKLGDKL